MRIIVDDRKEDDTYYGLMKKGFVGIKKERVEVADVLLCDGVAVERKGHDLLSSLTSGRLFEQLNALCEYAHPILCIVNENIWRDMYFNHSNWIHKSYEGLMTTLALSYPKLKVFQFTNFDEYIDFIVALDKKLHKEGKSERPAPRFRKTKKITTRMEDCLTAAEGISVSYSKKLLKEYNSISKLCNASVDDLMKIEGVGKSKAESIYKLLNEVYKK